MDIHMLFIWIFLYHLYRVYVDVYNPFIITLAWILLMGLYVWYLCSVYIHIEFDYSFTQYIIRIFTWYFYIFMWIFTRSSVKYSCTHPGYLFCVCIYNGHIGKFEKFLNKLINKFQNRLTFLVEFLSMFMCKSNPTQTLCTTNSETRIGSKLNVRLE